MSISLNTQNYQKKPANYAQNNQKQVGFGMKINLDADLAKLLATLPKSESAKVAKLLKKLENIGPAVTQQKTVTKKHFFGLFTTKKTVTVTKEPSCSLERDCETIYTAYPWSGDAPTTNISGVRALFSTRNGDTGSSFVNLDKFSKNPAKSIVRLITQAKRQMRLLFKINKDLKELELASKTPEAIARKQAIKEMEIQREKTLKETAQRLFGKYIKP